MGCCSCTNLKRTVWLNEEDQNYNNENKISMNMNKDDTSRHIKNISIGKAIPFKAPELKCDNLQDNTKGDEYEDMFKMLKNKSKNEESQSSINYFV